jgi:phosphonate transport system substrate-binding protein
MKKAFCFLLVLFFMFFKAYGGDFPKQVSAAPPKAGDEPLKIGVASMVTPVDTVKYYQEIIDYIAEQIGQPVKMIHRRTYEEMDALMERGEVKVAFICSAPYVRDRERFGIELLVAPSASGRPLYNSYIIVQKDSPLRSFSDLKGKVFAFTDPQSNTGKLYPTFLLKTMGTAPEMFFKRVTYSYSHNKSVELVAKKLADAAAVESLVYDYMLKQGSPYAKMTRIIKRSPPYGMPPVVTTRSLSPFLKERIREILLNMQNTAKGKAILDAMSIDGFVRIEDSAYDSIRVMMRAFTGGPAKAKKTKSGQTVRFGVIPRDNPRILYGKYQPLLDYLSEKTPYEYELVLKKSYEDTVEAIGSGELDLAFLGPLTYLEAHKKFEAVSILKPKNAGGSATYRSVIITKKDSQVRGLPDLRGRSVAFSAAKSTSGNLIPRYLLANSGIHLGELSHYENFDYHESVVKAVLKGQIDAGAVRDAVANKYMKLGIEVIATSEAIPTGPLVASPKAAYSVIESVRAALLDMDPKKAAHQKILKSLDDELRGGFTVSSDGDYADIRAKINAVPQVCGRGCHPRIKL